jgi:hypothetical protein
VGFLGEDVTSWIGLGLADAGSSAIVVVGVVASGISGA